MPARDTKRQLPAKLPPDAHPQTCRDALTACHEALYECLESLAAYRDLEALKFPDQPERRAGLEKLCQRLGIDFAAEPIWLWVLIGLELARETPEFKPRGRRRGRGRPKGSVKRCSAYPRIYRLRSLEARAVARETGRDERKIVNELAAELIARGRVKGEKKGVAKNITAVTKARDREQREKEIETLAAELFPVKPPG